MRRTLIHQLASTYYLRARRAAPIAFVLLLLTAIVAGCARAADNSTSSAAPALVIGALPADVAAVSYPLDAYRSSIAAARQVHDATYLGVVKCVAPLGLTLPPDDSIYVRDYKTNRYGLTNEAVARSRGYEPTVNDETPWAVRIVPTTQPELFAAVFGRGANGATPTAGTGIPPEGCQRHVENVIQAGIKSTGSKDLVSEIDTSSLTRSRSDARVANALAAWRTCMKTAGYDYEDADRAPFTYWTQQQMQRNPDPSADQKHAELTPSQAETSAAVTDVQCKATSGLLQTWIAADVAYQSQAIAKQTTVLQVYKANLDIISRNAQAILDAA